MNSKSNNFTKFLSRFSLCISLLLSTLIYKYLNNFRGHVFSVHTSLDDKIYFNKYFIIPYYYWYIYIISFLIYYAWSNDKKFYNILIRLNIGMLICYIIYFIFPTFTQRPDILGSDFISNIVKYTYKADNPYNCFPSIHALETFIIFFTSIKDTKLKPYMKIISALSAAFIIYSIFAVKQHYIMDAVSGFFIAALLSRYINVEFYSYFHKLPLIKVNTENNKETSY